MANKLSSVILPSSAKHTATIIFLHGLGDTGHGWAEGLRSVLPNYFRIVCPNAPSQPVTLNFGMSMPSWYDIIDLSMNSREDEDGVIKSSKILQDLIAQEVSETNIPASRICVGGFSQGGAVALYNLLTSSAHKLGAAAFLSTYLPLHKKMMAEPNRVVGHRDTPIFQAHGMQDSTVPFQFGQMTHSVITSPPLSFSDVTFKSYPDLAHSSDLQEMLELATFIKKQIPEL